MHKGRRWLLRLCLVAVLLALVVFPVSAQDYLFQVNERITHVYINDDGSIWIDYEITFTAESNSHTLDIIDVGLPNYDYNLAEVSADVDGVEIKDIRQSEIVQPGVEIHMGKFTIPAGGQGKLHVLARVRNMVFQDTSDPEYASMEFSPHWYTDGARGSMHLEIIVHFPEGVTPDEARYHDKEFTDSAVVDNRVAYAWIYENASPTRQYMVGVSFPKKYLKEGLPLVVTPEPLPTTPVGGGTSFTDWLCGGPMCFILGVLGFIAFIVISIKGAAGRKMKYLPPTVGVEGAGVKRGLTAVEAAILLETPLNKVLTMILFGLLKKNAATVLTQDPLTLEAMLPAPEGLRDYETEFLGAIADKKLDEKKLRQLMVTFIKSVNEKLKGFSRKDSIAYYKDLVARAWQQVEGAETPEVKSQRLDEGLEWTMLDEDWNKRVPQTFGDEPVFLPGWWQNYRPWNTTTTTGGGSAGQTVSVPKSTSSGTGRTTTMPTLPGSAFAGSIVGGVQNVSSKVVSSIERFTGGITSVTNPPPPPPKSSSSGRWRSGGGGGGHSCACACACAGCACACAGGGR